MSSVIVIILLPMVAIDTFVNVADRKFGPITVIRKDGHIVKKIPWHAFKFEEEDWDRVSLCMRILTVRNITFPLRKTCQH